MMDDIALNDVQTKCMDMLFLYRGLDAIQLAKLIYKTAQPTKSNEKYIYGQLSKLEEQGLVTRHKAIKKIHKNAIYFLVKKGFNFVQNELNLPEGYRGKGWIGCEEFDAGHFVYETFKLPIRQLKHFIATTDALIDCYLNDVTHRNNLYASRYTHNQTLLRADAEMIIKDENWAIEIDMGTESHKQLMEKFYHYFCYIGDMRDSLDIKHIVFVVDGAHDGHLKRRWTNILASFYKSMRGLRNKINLHLVLKSEFAQFISNVNNHYLTIDQILNRYRNNYPQFTFEVVDSPSITEIKYTDENGASNSLVIRIVYTSYSTESIYSFESSIENNKVLAVYEMSNSIYLSETLLSYEVDSKLIELYSLASKHSVQNISPR